MIHATIYHHNNEAIGFKIKSHGDPIVCAGVSALAINFLNSVEAFTPLQKGDFKAKWGNGGFIGFMLRKSDLRSDGSGLLLDSLVLGLSQICEQYPQDMSITYIIKERS